MLWIYNVGIILYGLLLKVIARFNPKAKQFIEGRKDIFERIKQHIDPKEKPIWFHFASLGEFEQGRPVLEKIKLLQPNQKIIVTFFSPSGYEIRKNYALASVFYLPLDTATNAEKFIKLINPQLAIFTKYEFWYHYFQALHRNCIPLYLISGIFRPNQVFFKWYGGFYRNILQCVTHFFLQNEESILLLKRIGLTNTTLGGDTRFDRVYENAQQPKQIADVANFCGDSPVFIAGSTWPQDETLLTNLIKKYPDWKFIIAPHEVHIDHIAEIEKLFQSAVKFSVLGRESESPGVRKSESDNNTSSISPPTSSILIIDNIGMLSSLYQYAKVAYIGGGFGVGIHNTLEAAAFGLPVIFGPKYDKFQEAKDLIAIGAARSINTEKGLIKAFDAFKENDQASAAAKKYVFDKKGATELIIARIGCH